MREGGSNMPLVTDYCETKVVTATPKEGLWAEYVRLDGAWQSARRRAPSFERGA